MNGAPSSAVRLFCFPYAGASASFYGRWKARLGPRVDVRAVEYPGHGVRLAEPLATDMATLVSQLLPEVLREAHRPFALFGHSLGAVVAFELAHELRDRTGREPVALFASGTSAPSVRDAQRYARLGNDSSDEELLSELSRLGGTPAAALADASLMSLTLPMLRADFQVCASYRFRPRQRLGCLLQALGGGRDGTVPNASALAWSEHTRGDFAFQAFDGDHFFIHQREPEVLELVGRRLASLAPGGEAQRSAFVS